MCASTLNSHYYYLVKEHFNWFLLPCVTIYVCLCAYVCDAITVSVNG